MSLTSFIRKPENAAKLKVLRPPPPRTIGEALIVPPRSKRQPLIGTAFDYLLRFEIERRAPDAKAHRWVAQGGAEYLFQTQRKGDGPWRSLIPDDQLANLTPYVAADSLDESEEISFGPETAYSQRAGPSFTVERCAPSLRRSGEVYDDSVKIAYKIGKRALGMVQAAKLAHERYIKLPAPDCEDQEEIARHTIRLARLDSVFRARSPDQTLLQEPESDDVQELVALLAIVPFDALLNKPLVLNPTFGDSSLQIGGADCDLLTGDMLIDIKTTTAASMTAHVLDQLLGYYLLSRNERSRNPRFPEIKRLGLYFVRHGCLWVQPVSKWVEQPRFSEIEKWFYVTALRFPVPRFRPARS